MGNYQGGRLSLYTLNNNKLDKNQHASTEDFGIVKLSDNISNNSKLEAATISSVKQVNDKIDNHTHANLSGINNLTFSNFIKIFLEDNNLKLKNYNNILTITENDVEINGSSIITSQDKATIDNFGITKLSSSIESDNENIAATSKAVKCLNDKIKDTITEIPKDLELNNIIFNDDIKIYIEDNQLVLDNKGNKLKLSINDLLLNGKHIVMENDKRSTPLLRGYISNEEPNNETGENKDLWIKY